MFRSLRALSARLSSSLPSEAVVQGVSSQHEAKPLYDAGQLNIPVAKLCAADLIGRKAVERGRHFARQGMWAKLSEEMREADQSRETAPCGQPIAELLAFGARADVVLAVEHALSEGKAISDYDLLGGISELEAELQDHPNDPMIGLVVVLAHIDLAWAWRGTTRDTSMHPQHWSRCAAHFDRAAAILPGCIAAAKDSPVIAAAECALFAGQGKTQNRVADKYERLISLDPQNHRHMRSMGSHLLPRWFGSYQELELQALRTAARTHDVWGAGGYTWVQFDAIQQDHDARARVDVDYFIDGLRDIVQRRPEQQMVNLLAAYCAITLPIGRGLNPQADEKQAQISSAADWLIRDHLTELHPLIWAHAADGFNNSVRINSPERFAARGHRDALRAIADLFRDELHSGKCVTFTPAGLQLSGN